VVALQKGRPARGVLGLIAPCIHAVDASRPSPHPSPEKRGSIRRMADEPWEDGKARKPCRTQRRARHQGENVSISGAVISWDRRKRREGFNH
jgi:hypothetical protein